MDLPNRRDTSDLRDHDTGVWGDTLTIRRSSRNEPAELLDRRSDLLRLTTGVLRSRPGRWSWAVHSTIRRLHPWWMMRQIGPPKHS